MPRTVLLRRSALKALTYRILIMCLDFATIYFFTGKLKFALGFMVMSNVYTTVACGRKSPGGCVKPKRRVTTHG